MKKNTPQIWKRLSLIRGPFDREVVPLFVQHVLLFKWILCRFSCYYFNCCGEQC